MPISVEHLTRAYGEFTAVDDLSFEVGAGEIVGLIGPNGAGKTTTLRTLAGILRPTAGTVRIDGHDIVEDALEAKRRLAFMPDEPLTGLVPIGIRRMRETIVARGRAGASILVSSHLLHLVEEICTRVIIMDRGRKIADGTVAELASRADLAQAGSNLEQIFLRVTGHDKAPTGGA